MGDDYLHAGPDLSDNTHFVLTQAYFGGYNPDSEVSFEFDKTVSRFKEVILSGGYPTNITNMTGYLATREKAGELRQDFMNNNKPETFCQIPVYSPTQQLGAAEIMIKSG
jgi:hypothetical protein